MNIFKIFGFKTSGKDTAKERVFNDKAPVKGSIKFYGLVDWWLNQFTYEERKEIFDKCYIDKEVYFTSRDVVSYLAGMWTQFDDINPIKEKVAQKIYDVFNSQNRSMVISMHFFLLSKMGNIYKQKERPNYKSYLINVCQESIEFSPKAAMAFKQEYKDFLPSHPCFRRLAILFEKEKMFSEAIAICKKAQKEGWSGDWQKRIQRCQTRAEKMANN